MKHPLKPVTSPAKAQPKLTIAHSGETGSALTMTYAEPPRGFNVSDVLTLLFGVGLVMIGAVISYGDIGMLRSFGYWFSVAIFLVPGISVIYYSFTCRKRLQNGLTIRYLVSVQDGVVTFLHDGDATTQELARINRVWIERSSVNGITSNVQIMASCDGNEALLFDIMGISRLLGEDDYLLVTGIVDFLNKHCAAGHDKIQAGYYLEHNKGENIHA